MTGVSTDMIIVIFCHPKCAAYTSYDFEVHSLTVAIQGKKAHTLTWSTLQHPIDVFGIIILLFSFYYHNSSGR